MKYLSLFMILTLFWIPALMGQSVWKGGAPGDTNNWNNPKNWSNHSVPDETCIVVIPNLSTQGNFYPVVEDVLKPIGSLFIGNDARLKIKKNGELTIDGICQYLPGIQSFGLIDIEGSILLKNIGLERYVGMQNLRIVFEQSGEYRLKQYVDLHYAHTDN